MTKKRRVHSIEHHPIHSVHHEHHEHHEHHPTTHQDVSEKVERASHDVEKINALLIENFVNLQKVMTNTADKLDNLSIQISRLLSLFEQTAKNFTEKVSTGMPEIEKDKEFLDKLNKLLDQNKTIAKGLTLMEEKVKERVYGAERPMQYAPQMQPQMQQQTQQIPPLPRFQAQMPRFAPPKEEKKEEEMTPSSFDIKTKEI